MRRNCSCFRTFLSLPHGHPAAEALLAFSAPTSAHALFNFYLSFLLLLCTLQLEPSLLLDLARDTTAAAGLCCATAPHYISTAGGAAVTAKLLQENHELEMKVKVAVAGADRLQVSVARL